MAFTGILYGTLTMEYGGRVSIECDKTGYKTELEFKLKVRGSSSVSLHFTPHVPFKSRMPVLWLFLELKPFNVWRKNFP